MKKRLKNTLILLFSMLLVVLITSCAGVFQVGPWIITITNNSGVIIDLFISASSEGPWDLQDSYFPGGPFESQPIAHGTFIRIFRRPPINQLWWWYLGMCEWQDYWLMNESFSVTISDEVFIVEERVIESSGYKLSDEQVFSKSQ